MKQKTMKDNKKNIKKQQKKQERQKRQQNKHQKTAEKQKCTKIEKQHKKHTQTHRHVGSKTWRYTHRSTRNTHTQNDTSHKQAGQIDEIGTQMRIATHTHTQQTVCV